MRSFILVTTLAALGAAQRASNTFTYEFSPGSPTQPPNWKDIVSAKLHHTNYYPTCRDALEQCIQLWQSDWRYKQMGREEATYHCEIQFTDMKSLCPHPLNHEVSEFLDPTPECSKALKACLDAKPDPDNKRSVQCRTDLEKNGVCAQSSRIKRDETPWKFPNCDSAVKSCVEDKPNRDSDYPGRFQCLEKKRAQGICPYPVAMICDPKHGGCRPAKPATNLTVQPSVAIDPSKTTLIRRASAPPPVIPTTNPDYTCEPYFLDCMRLDDWRLLNENVSKRDLCCGELVQKRLCTIQNCPLHYTGG